VDVSMESDREVLCYNTIANRDNAHHLFSLVTELTSNASYRPYECPIVVPWPISVDKGPRSHDRFMAIQAARCSKTKAIDLAYQAAFRSQPLGNSDVMPDHMYGTMTAEKINEFVQSTHGPSGLVVVGSGVEHAMLVDAATTFGVNGGAALKPTPATSQYLAGDARVDAGGDLAHVVIAGPGAPFAERLTAQVAAALLDGSPHLAALGAEVAGVSGSYKCTGLLGIYMAVPHALSGKVTTAVAGWLRQYQPSEAEVADAVAKVRTSLASAHGAAEAGLVGRQLLQEGTLSDQLAALDAVTPAQVSQALSTAFSGKLSVGAYGTIKDVPYSDTL